MDGLEDLVQVLHHAGDILDDLVRVGGGGEGNGIFFRSVQELTAFIAKSPFQGDGQTVNIKGIVTAGKCYRIITVDPHS